MIDHVCGLACGEYDQVALNLMGNFYMKGRSHKTLESEQIDREVARDVPCERCSVVGGRYESWANSEGGVALSICPTCNHATMF